MTSEIQKCRVCGHDCSPFFPWGPDGNFPSYSICPRCGIEFGYEDSSDEGILRARRAFFENPKPSSEDDKNKSNIA